MRKAYRVRRRGLRSVRALSRHTRASRSVPRRYRDRIGVRSEVGVAQHHFILRHATQFHPPRQWCNGLHAPTRPGMPHGVKAEMVERGYRVVPLVSLCKSAQLSCPFQWTP